MRRPGKDLPSLLTTTDPIAPSGFGPSKYRPTSHTPTTFRINNHSPTKIRDSVRENAPRTPGVYGMLGAKGHIIYVGKAKNLRARLLSYFRDSSDPKAGKILRHTYTLLWEETADELAALLRELELIRQHRPRYNVLGQPGRQRYAYLCLGRGPATYAYTTPEPTGKLVACYGPFVGRRRTQLAVRWLNQQFRLRDCPSTVKMDFADQRPLFELDLPAKCLRYELGTCLAPCAGQCSSKNYGKNVRAAKAFLDGRDRTALHSLQKQMTEAAERQEYERAGILRDRLHLLTKLDEKLTFLRTARSADAFVYPLSGLWYLIHGGEVQAVVHEPKCPATIAEAKRMLKLLFDKPAGSATNPDRVGDSVLIVSRWFRQNVEERAKLIPPKSAGLHLSTLGPSPQIETKSGATASP